MSGMKEILVPISPGELLDKITILRIKIRRISDPVKVSNVQRELSALETIWSDSVRPSHILDRDERELEIVNEALWEIVEDIHRLEAAGQFDDLFMLLARRVCTENDRRAAVKKRINVFLESSLIEEKSHQ